MKSNFKKLVNWTFYKLSRWEPDNDCIKDSAYVNVLCFGIDIIVYPYLVLLALKFETKSVFVEQHAT